MGYPISQGLYDPAHEHDACGVGMVAHIKGEKSHAIITQALEILEKLDHRGAVGADPLLGDGAGILIQIPDPLIRAWALEQGHDLPAPGDYAVAMCFLPQDEAARAFVMERMEALTAKEGQRFIGWRDVPTTLDGLGAAVLASMPVIKMAIVARGENCADQDAFERKLLVIRKQLQNPLAQLAERHGLAQLTETYIPSFSSRTLVYKGLLLATQVGSFYDDLRNPDCVSALGLVHQRFSTNTFPSWRLAHPFRFIAHNGEINTVRGNVNWMNARRRTMESELLGPDLDKMWPII
ncbi:MAG: glutamate synthase subunit alpha, partial [Erythrobacter cryptus]